MGQAAATALVAIVIVSILTLTGLATVGGPGEQPRTGKLTDDPILEIRADALTSYKYSGTSAIQDVRPQILQRGVRLEGSVRAGAAFPMAFAGNPHEPAQLADAMQQIHLPTGNPTVDELDLALPANVMWPIRRSYNGVQKTSGGAHHDSDGYQGTNWFQNSQMEIRFYDGNDNTKDLLIVLYGADRFIQLRRYSSNSNAFKATNGAAGIALYTAASGSEPDTYKYTDAHGMSFTFFGFHANAGSAGGQLWRVQDPAGNVAFAGDATTGSTAISSGYSSGKILYAYDSADRRYSYTYSTVGSKTRLTQVKAEVKSGGTWTGTPTGVTEVGRVDYSYYSADADSYGDEGDLKHVTVTIPQTDSGVDSVRKTYYRYWEGTYNSSTNPGYPHTLKLIVGPEGTRQHDWQDVTFDDDFLTETHDNLKPYAAAYFEYNSNYQVSSAWFQGACGCPGGTGSGSYAFTYGTNGSYSDSSGYDTTWATRTIVNEPSGLWVTVQFDETGQPITQIETDIDPASTSPAPKKWVTNTPRGTDGLVTSLHTPANITAFTYSDGSVTASGSAGLVHSYSRIASNETKG
jgi:hypothetical protein